MLFRFLLIVCCIAYLAEYNAAQAVPPKVPVALKLKVGDITSVEIQSEPGKETAWAAAFPPESVYLDEGKPARKDTVRLIVSPKVRGTYRVILWTVGERDYSTLIIDVNGDGPNPPGPTPPIPPDPTPDTIPIPLDGFRVLIVYEQKDLAKLPKEQVSILTSQTIRQYFNLKCVKGADGKTPESRIWDKDTDVSADSEHWRKALARPRTGLPWILISTGKTGYEGPLPANVDDTLKLLKKYGGE